MLVKLGKALVAIGVAVAGAKKYDGKKNPNWANIHWPKK
jgi:hypothetical protein